jgi:hypothetical protein
MYGIRCPDLVVVDMDNRHTETLAYAEQHFGCSLYRVRTARGEHWYYRVGATPPKRCNIRQGNVAIDVKHGANCYAVGPGSIRPDTGERYEMIGKMLPTIADLPVFKDLRGDRTEKPSASSPVVVDVHGNGIPVGQRFDALKVKAREFARNVSSRQELFDALVAYMHAAFEDSDSFELRKLEQVTDWTWQKRQEGNLWGGTNAPVLVLPVELAQLDQYKNGPDALRLLLELRRCHAAQPGKWFSIATHAMAKSGLLPGWTESRYRRAKATLLSIGLIRQIKSGGLLNGPSEYQLVRLPVPG